MCWRSSGGKRKSADGEAFSEADIAEGGVDLSRLLRDITREMRFRDVNRRELWCEGRARRVEVSSQGVRARWCWQVPFKSIPGGPRLVWESPRILVCKYDASAAYYPRGVRVRIRPHSSSTTSFIVGGVVLGPREDYPPGAVRCYLLG